MIVKPVEGRLVRDPATMRPLPPEGIPARDGDLHWEQMRAYGDVTLHPDPAPAEPAPASEVTDR